jgi:uncharacterized protein involved in tellurium resistance
MSIPRNPREAPPRPDLTFLRHRGRRPAPAPPPPPPVPLTQRHPGPPAPSPPAPSPPAPSPPAPPATSGSPLDLTPPAAPPATTGSPLDLTPPAAPAATTGSSLDLGPPVSPGSSLDLGPPAAAPPSSTAPGPATRHRPPTVRDARRTAEGSAPTRLAGAHPTVTLTRLQSGTGALELSLTRPASAGDLALGCVFELADGVEAVVQELGGVTAGPPGTPLPVVRWKGRADGESLFVDLRRVRDLRRALVYGYSPSVAVLAWSGVLVITTYGGARIEVPIESGSFSGTLALLTIYNVAGELVLRAEMDGHHGPPETAAVAYDHHLPWLDGRTPLT